MAAIGTVVRRSLGRFEQPVSDAYRRFFVDLKDLVDTIESWCAPKNILEIGCGEGALAIALKDRFAKCNYLGIDIIPHAGRLYRGPKEGVSFQEIRAEVLADKRPAEFDLIVVNDVLHHIPQEEREAVMSAARDLLAPNGYLVMKDWCRRATPIHALVYFADVYIGGDKGVHYMDIAEQRKLIDNIFGFSAVQQEKTIRPWKQNHAFLIAASNQTGQAQQSVRLE